VVRLSSPTEPIFVENKALKVNVRRFYQGVIAWELVKRIKV